MKAIKEIKQQLAADAAISYVQRDPYTMATARASYGGMAYEAIGFSKRNPRDLPDPELGKTIAAGRALHDIAWRVFNAQARAGEFGEFMCSKVRAEAVMPAYAT